MTAAKLTKTQARALLREIRDGALNFQRKIGEFAEGEGYAALGYSSFPDCWEGEKMNVDTLVSTQFAKGAVIKAAWEAGHPPSWMVKVKGISTPVARRAYDLLERNPAYPVDQLVSGNPTRTVGSLPGWVPGHDRKPENRQPHNIVIECSTPGEREEYVRRANELGHASVAHMFRVAVDIYLKNKDREGALS